MRYFLVVVLAVTSFFAAGQDVVIPADVARYYLEQNDKVELLEKKDSLSTQEINSLTTTIALKDSVIVTYKKDKETYEDTIDTKNSEQKLLKDELRLARKEIRKQRFYKTVGFIGMGVMTIIALL